MDEQFDRNFVEKIYLTASGGPLYKINVKNFKKFLFYVPSIPIGNEKIFVLHLITKFMKLEAKCI